MEYFFATFFPPLTSLIADLDPNFSSSFSTSRHIDSFSGLSLVLIPDLPLGGDKTFGGWKNDGGCKFVGGCKNVGGVKILGGSTTMGGVDLFGSIKSLRGTTF